MHQPCGRAGTTNRLALFAGTCVVGMSGALLFAFGGLGSKQNETTQLVKISAQRENTEPSNPSKEVSTQFEITINKPNGPPRVATGVTDSDGHEVTVACMTCHATRKPDFNNKRSQDLNEFHGSLELDHGEMSCLSCHNSNDYDALKLADGKRIEFVDVMTLCGQCHGTQMKDYRHGAHGGMTGHWDLSKGPRAKNNCVDCHHPHSPQFPKMQPTFKPKDRFLNAIERKHSSKPTDSDSSGHRHTK